MSENTVPGSGDWVRCRIRRRLSTSYECTFFDVHGAMMSWMVAEQFVQLPTDAADAFQSVGFCDGLMSVRLVGGNGNEAVVIPSGELSGRRLWIAANQLVGGRPPKTSTVFIRKTR